MRIYKETLLRLPPQGFERWNCIHSLVEYEDFYKPFSAETHKPFNRIVACADAWWYDITGVHPSYLEAYQTCGPIGFSCDLTRISDGDRTSFAEFIASVKEKREFWKKAVARILCDTDTVTVFQYSDMKLKEIMVQVVSGEAIQEGVTVYPVVCEEKMYLIDGEKKMSGKEIMQEGIDVPITGWKEMSKITLAVVD